MSEFVKGILIGLIPALVVSVLTSLLTVRLSLRQFYTQRWWERKAEAYSEIMKHLSTFKFFIDELEFSRLTEEADSQARNNTERGYKEEMAAITKAAACGSYMVSDPASEALSELLAKVYENEWDGDNSAEALQESSEAVKHCIEVVKSEARKELRTKRM